MRRQFDHLFQLLQVSLNEFEFGDELGLLEGQTTQPSRFFGANALSSELLQFQGLGICCTMPRS